jgi:ADP-ribosyl-[dinitrogen reductase] hydrolase
MTVIDSLRDRYRGVLLGLAAGDALGATVEFESRDSIRQRYGIHRDIVGGGWLNLQAGEVTDDTQMALCIARSIAHLGRFDAADIANRFVEWYRSDPKDIGNTTRHALEQLAAGARWDEAGWKTHVALQPRDASNGSVMRAAPVALYARGDSQRLARHSAESSLITHANPRCVAGCVALNAAIAAMLDDPDSDVLRHAFDATDQPDVRRALEGARRGTADTLDAGGSVLSTLQASFWALTEHRSLEDAIVAAVNLGQDADTTGAVTGALAGARWGMAAIPGRWREVILLREELSVLADQLLELSLGGASQEQHMRGDANTPRRNGAVGRQ